MNKTLLMAASCLMLFTACKKEAKQAPEIKESSLGRYPVSFGISDFTVTTTPITNSLNANHSKSTFAVPPISNYSQRIIFLVFDQTGKQVSRLEQLSDESNKTYRIKNDKKVLQTSKNSFGAIADTLSNGTYTLIAVGAYPDVSLNRRVEGTVTSEYSTKYPESSLANTKLWSDYDHAGFGTMFYYKGQFTVNNGASSNNITLQRKTGTIQFSIEDTFPANAKWISVVIENEAQYLNLSTGLPGGKAESDGTGGFGVQGFPTPLSLAVMNSSTPVTLHVRVKDVNDNLVTEKVIADIAVGSKDLVTVRGKMFSNASGFNLIVDPSFENYKTITF